MGESAQKKGCWGMRTILILALLSGGCSYALTSKPPKTGTCARSKVPAIVDASIAAGATAGAITAFALLDDSSDTRNLVVGSLLVAAVIEAAVADSGFSNVGECRARK
jgi:hypothetical protein